MRTLEEIAADVRRIAEELRAHGNTTARDRAEELSRTAYRLDNEAGPKTEHVLSSHYAGWTEYDSSHD